MKKSLATWALAAAGGLSVSACSGSTASGPSAIAPLPNAPPSLARGKRAHPNDNGVADLHAGGADVPGYAYNLANQPTGYYYNAQTPPGQGSLFYSAPTQGTIYYCINNSTDGRKAFEGSGDSGFPPTGPCAPLGATATGFGGRQDPLDFVGTATAMPSTEYTAYKSVREPSSGTSWGEPFEFPQIGAPIVYGYRPQDFKNHIKKLHLSTWTYCAIANGTISDWNDPAVTADNKTSITGETPRRLRSIIVPTARPRPTTSSTTSIRSATGAGKRRTTRRRTKARVEARLGASGSTRRGPDQARRAIRT